MFTGMRQGLLFLGVCVGVGVLGGGVGLDGCVCVSSCVSLRVSSCVCVCVCGTEYMHMCEWLRE